MFLFILLRQKKLIKISKVNIMKDVNFYINIKIHLMLYNEKNINRR